MAKIVNCPICGKEMKKGLFTGDDMLLDMGEKMVSVCPTCYEQYEHGQKYHAKRFGAKVRNYQKATRRKLSEAEQLQQYIAYRREGEAYGDPYAGDDSTMVVGGSIKVAPDGRFSVMEFSNDFGNSDVNTKDMLRSAKKATLAEDVWFTKEDITKIEYFPNGSGDFNGMFEKAYSYSVRFNDETEITFCPGITRVVTVGSGVMFGYREKAEQILKAQLIVFRDMIGSDLPIVRTKK